MDRGCEYRAWRNMKNRCYNTKTSYYPRYGGRGIVVCERWAESYENFLSDMGRKPSSLHSLERKNNDLGYTPENCIWGTWKDQARNKRNNNIVEFNGEKILLIELCEKIGVKRHTVQVRMLRGMSLEDALFVPLQKRRSRI